jgi:general secretion pathway protein G
MTALSIRNVRRASRKGFTLIEILIVVIILGILAAIVIPQFSSASTQARTSALQSTVQTLRSQIALYKLQHGDTLPNIVGANAWTPLTATSTYSGTTYGPYLPAVPTNPMSNGFVVINGTSAGGVSTGADYVYDYASGTGSGNIWGTTTNGGTILP